MDYRDLRRELLKKAHAAEDRRGDHVHFFIEVDGKDYRATKISHGATGQIGQPLEGMIARQLRLSTTQLRDFVECPLDGDAFLENWRLGEQQR